MMQSWAASFEGSGGGGDDKHDPKEIKYICVCCIPLNIPLVGPAIQLKAIEYILCCCIPLNIALFYVPSLYLYVFYSIMFFYAL